MDANEWREECNYISKTTDLLAGRVSEMNFDLPTFVRYCRMRQAQATKQGFHDAAAYIQHCIDDLTGE